MYKTNADVWSFQVFSIPVDWSLIKDNIWVM